MSTIDTSSSTSSSWHTHNNNSQHNNDAIDKPSIYVPGHYNNNNNNDNQQCDYPPSHNDDKRKQIQVARASMTARKEALLRLPQTQSREIFSVSALSDRARIPFIKLPSATQQDAAPHLDDRKPNRLEEEETDDSDVEDVEELLLELAHELDINDKAYSRVSKEHPAATPSALTLHKGVFSFPPSDYFSPGAPFLGTTGTLSSDDEANKPADSAGPESEPPTISVRIAGGDLIQDVFLSPIVEQQRSPLSRKNSKVEEIIPTEEDQQTKLDVHSPPFSLRPPPHLTRSRRTSRTIQQSQQLQQQQQTSAADLSPETHSQASSRNSSTSAVSPRFMALRKLSHSLTPGADMVLDTATSHHHHHHYHRESSNAGEDGPGQRQLQQPQRQADTLEDQQQQLLQKIEVMIEDRLLSNVAQIAWRASESQRSWWEEQKRELVDLAGSILNKLEGTAQTATPVSEAASKIPQKPDPELERLRRQHIDLENEVSTYRMKQIGLQRQLFELDIIKAHNAELESQQDQLRQRNTELEHANEQHAKRIQELEQQVAKSSKDGTDWAEAVAADERYKELEARYRAQKEESERRMAELEKENRRLKQIENVNQLQLDYLQQELDGRQQQQQQQQQNKKTRKANKRATMMASLPPKRSQQQQQQHLQVQPPRRPSSAMALSRRESHRQSYFMDEEGHLTFTTEVDGRLSQYTVKMPALPRPTSTPPQRRTNTTTISSNSSKLNPNAAPWGVGQASSSSCSPPSSL
ncbi:hypothetical protein BCR43DRAFT_484635 [Syncephalastrum racemosum]|uniref:Uncharacterized protein n=1 Tax=Syncephalastrum racemosum TaxID=13706 RepID=A0A1X2HKW4_SYNRA|nr:hypothetical protein BCR43DRAFT_484635 [Syncephalastrum racemosum]